MRRRLHLHDFFVQAIAKSLRDAGRTADAEVFENLPGSQWAFGYVSGNTFGSSGNPCKGYGGNIKAYDLTVARQMTYANGLKNSNGINVLHGIALIPKGMRPPYIGDLTATQANGLVDVSTMGVDMSKTGCYYLSVSGTGNAKYIVVVGSDESVTDATIVSKYLPFDMPINLWNGGISARDKTVKGYSGEGSSSISNNRIMPVEVWVYQSTSPATPAKEQNPNLPDFKWNDFSPKPPSDKYTTIPALNLTLDWTAITAKYKTKVHINTILIDLIVDALTKAGDSATATKVAAMNPETFLPWQTVADTTNKKTTLVGARDTTTKLYFTSITFNNYLNKNYVMTTDLGYVYHADAGISWTTVADLAAIKANAGNGLFAESAMGYFGKHVAKLTPFNGDFLETVLPFSVKGMGVNVPDRGPLSTDTQQYLTTPQTNAIWTGNNGYRIYIYPDR